MKISRFTVTAEQLLVIAIFVVAVAFRWYSFHHHVIAFWFDQTRDAHVSRQILENHDLKLLGPSASGTNDTVYHGVLYYYLIGPAYTLGQGDPSYPTAVLYILASLAIFPLFYLIKDLFGSSRVALLSILFYAFSIEAAQLAGWLSNPSMAILPLAVYYLALWKIFYRQKPAWLIPAGLAFGLIFQSVLWLVFTLGPAAVGLYYAVIIRKQRWDQVLPIKTTLLAILGAGILILPWLLGQLMLARNGVFTLSAFADSSLREQVSNSIMAYDVINLFFNKGLFSLVPSFTIASFILLAWIGWRLTAFTQPQKIFILSWLLSPLWLFVWHPRVNIHLFIGIEMMLLALLAEAILNGLPRYTSRLATWLVPIALICLVIFSNIKVMLYFRQAGGSVFSQQAGAVLRDQMALIDTTYQIAQGQPFTFSSYTNPIGYNISWAYLYNWYGQAKYGYKPVFVGPDQTGLFGAELLDYSPQPAQIHFSIIEPVSTYPELHAAFLSVQPDSNAGYELQNKQLFGTIQLQTRISTLSAQTEPN